MNANRQFTIVIVGDRGVGKSTFINRHKTGMFTRAHVPTNAIVDTLLSFSTSVGQIDIIVKEVLAFQNIPRCDGCIVMFDTCNRITFKNVNIWIRDVVKSNGNIPITVCGNKVDIPARKVRTKSIRSEQFPARGYTYYDISARSNYNFEKPFLRLLQELVANDVDFVETTEVSCLPSN